MKRISKVTRGLVLVASLGLWMPARGWADAETDQRIERAAAGSHVFRERLKEQPVKVEVKDGMVTLKGSVETDSQKQLAENTVAELPGVTKVDNQLAIKQPLGERLSDQWIETKVKAVLLYHRSVSGLNTTVEVKDGVVTLSGKAENRAQKELAAEYARDVDGVKNVLNTIEVTPAEPAAKPKTESNPVDGGLGQKIDDASITAEAKLVLLLHRSTSAMQTHLKTQNGVVTVTGTAANQAQLDLVTKLIQDIGGVKSVLNQMTVEQ